MHNEGQRSGWAHVRQAKRARSPGFLLAARFTEHALGLCEAGRGIAPAQAESDGRGSRVGWARAAPAQDIENRDDRAAEEASGANNQDGLPDRANDRCEVKEAGKPADERAQERAGGQLGGDDDAERHARFGAQGFRGQFKFILVERAGGQEHRLIGAEARVAQPEQRVACLLFIAEGDDEVKL